MLAAKCNENKFTVKRRVKNSIKHRLFYKNKLYKNNEDEIGKQTRTNQEHFEAGKFKEQTLQEQRG